MHFVIEEFRRLIESDLEILHLLNQIFDQIPPHSAFDKDPLGRPRIRDYHDLLAALDGTITRAPEWNGEDPGVKCLPVSALLHWPLSTTSGRACLQNKKINGCIRAVLNAWAEFLTSEASVYVLNSTPQGWFCDSAQAFIMSGTIDHHKTRMFAQEFVCDPNKPWHGFASWDAFFTRSFRPGIRPVTALHDQDTITSACEAAPYRLAIDVQAHDTFWLKGHPYSLKDMLADHPLSASFIGGTVYQGFLNAGSYHRWHSPVDGRVVGVYLQPGTYFTKLVQPQSASVSKYAPENENFDPADPVDSQAYLAQVSSRAMIFIKADSPRIGLMCVMPVGWVEVSTCEVTVREGQRVAKGAQLGMFHFGGSTHCLLFRPGMNLSWDLRGQEPGPSTRTIPVNSRIAHVRA